MPKNEINYNTKCKPGSDKEESLFFVLKWVQTWQILTFARMVG
jgi:hypothetical protein